jgi:DNA polymerase
VWGEGPTTAQMVFVGEAPGPDEVKKGRPFQGAAGWRYDIALSGAGVERRAVYTTNCVKCMPPSPTNPDSFRTPTHDEVEFCASRFLAKELATIKPNIVVAMGETAFRWFKRDLQGKGILEWRGYIVDAVTRDV